MVIGFMMRHRARRDANHEEIVACLRSIGFSVLDLAAVGGGCPDLVVGLAGINILCEIKDGSKSPSARQLTPDQQEFFATWHGEVWVVKDNQDCLRLREWVYNKAAALKKSSNIRNETGVNISHLKGRNW